MYRNILALGLAGVHFGCMPSAASNEDGDSSGSSDEGAGGVGAGVSTGVGASGGNGQGAGSAAVLGVVVVDIQETFVDGASNSDIAAILERSKTLFDRGAESDVPFFITFEASQTEAHALHSSLQSAVPSQAQLFTKTTFAATGLDTFAAATTAAGITHALVIGAETDVCVLQTVLGLRAMGFEVLLQTSAVFSEETNVGPSLRRMEQAGVTLVSEADVEGFLADPTTLPSAATQAVRIVRPLELGVVLNAFSDASFSAASDVHRAAKVARLRELLLVSEWFELPVYVDDVAAGLPADLADYYWGALRPVSQIASDAAVTQLVFAGTTADAAAQISPWIGARDVFVMEDALVGDDAQLAPLLESGLVPTTYKTFYYDMTTSVDFAEWPSQTWVDRVDEYYDITQAPEDLPPIDPD